MRYISIILLVCFLFTLIPSVSCYTERTKGYEEYYLEKAARNEQVAITASEEASKHWEQYNETGDERSKDLAERYDELAEEYRQLAEYYRELAAK